MFLPILAVWILLPVSADSHVHPPCCHAGEEGVNGNIERCFEQKPRPTCQKHFYVLITKDGPACINPDSKWLQRKIWKGILKCSPEIGSLD